MQLVVLGDSSDIYAWGWQSYLPSPVATLENIGETLTGGAIGGALGELQIQFTNGRVYSYANVLDSEFEAMSLSPSKGSAFWAYIRRNPVAHPFTRLA